HRHHHAAMAAFHPRAARHLDKNGIAHDRALKNPDSNVVLARMRFACEAGFVAGAWHESPEEHRSSLPRRLPDAVAGLGGTLVHAGPAARLARGGLGFGRHPRAAAGGPRGDRPYLLRG